MRNIGFVFPGQGAQKLGMLADLAASTDVVTDTFAEASAVLGKDLWEVSQIDQSEQLNQTDITQQYCWQHQLPSGGYGRAGKACSLRSSLGTASENIQL